MGTVENANRFYWLLIGATLAVSAMLIYLGLQYDPRFMEMFR